VPHEYTDGSSEEVAENCDAVLEAWERVREAIRHLQPGGSRAEFEAANAEAVAADEAFKRLWKRR